VRPGTPGLEHRIGGLEKADKTGNVSYDSDNHGKMVALRQAKIDGIVDDIPDAEHLRAPGHEGNGKGPGGELLLVGWGGTYGALRAATLELQAMGHAVGHLHLRHMHPMSKNVGPTIAAYKTVIAAELNTGQLRHLLRARFLVDVRGYNQVRGQPFKVGELVAHALAALTGEAGVTSVTVDAPSEVHP